MSSGKISSFQTRRDAVCFSSYTLRLFCRLQSTFFYFLYIYFSWTSYFLSVVQGSLFAPIPYCSFCFRHPRTSSFEKNRRKEKGGTEREEKKERERRKKRNRRAQTKRKIGTHSATAENRRGPFFPQVHAVLASPQGSRAKRGSVFARGSCRTACVNTREIPLREEPWNGRVARFAISGGQTGPASRSVTPRFVSTRGPPFNSVFVFVRYCYLFARLWDSLSKEWRWDSETSLGERLGQ